MLIFTCTSHGNGLGKNSKAPDGLPELGTRLGILRLFGVVYTTAVRHDTSDENGESSIAVAQIICSHDCDMLGFQVIVV